MKKLVIILIPLFYLVPLAKSQENSAQLPAELSDDRPAVLSNNLVSLASSSDASQFKGAALDSSDCDEQEFQEERAGLFTKLWGGLVYTAQTLQTAYGVAHEAIADVVDYAYESVDPNMPFDWDEKYADACLTRGQCNFLKQYLDRLLMSGSSSGTLAQANAALVWAKKKANEGHTLCLYEVTRLFSKTVATSVGAIDQVIVQDYLNLLVLFFYRIAIDCIKIRAGVLDGGEAIKDKEKRYADKIRRLFGARIAIFAAEGLYQEAKKFASDWLDKNAANGLPSFVETYSMELRKRVSSGTYCQTITETNIKAFLHNDKALASNQPAIIELVKNFFSSISSLEELLSSGGIIIQADSIDQIIDQKIEVDE